MKDILKVCQLLIEGHVSIAICFLGTLEPEPNSPEERIANRLAEIALEML